MDTAGMQLFLPQQCRQQLLPGKRQQLTQERNNPPRRSHNTNLATTTAKTGSSQLENKVYLPGRFSEKLLPENLARMYLKGFIYYAIVNRENNKAWVKAS